MAKILVIEDMPSVLMSLQMILAASGHDVTCATDGITGLRLIIETMFDLVVTDIWMPGLNGMDVISRGRARWPGTLFLAITGGDPDGGAPATISGVENFGADGVLFKPFVQAALLAAVGMLLSESRLRA
jgi:DNA-binding response OmpR family regulator